MDQKRGAAASPIQRLTLDHWFLNYQLESVRDSHVHLQGTMDVDVTEITERHDPANPTAMLTAIAAKALGLVMEKFPVANRFHVKTFFGPRIVQVPYIAINLPLQIEHEGRRILSAAIIQDPHRKTVSEIQEEIRSARAKGLSDKPITRFVATRANTWYNRLLLRAVYAFGYRMPSLFLKRKVGGLSLTSVVFEGKNAPPLWTVGFGPTAFTVTLTSVWVANGRRFLKVGVAFDHLVGTGDLAVVFARHLHGILTGGDKALAQRLAEGAAPAATSTFGEIAERPRQPSSPTATA